MFFVDSSQRRDAELIGSAKKDAKGIGCLRGAVATTNTPCLAVGKGMDRSLKPPKQLHGIVEGFQDEIRVRDVIVIWARGCTSRTGQLCLSVMAGLEEDSCLKIP